MTGKYASVVYPSWFDLGKPARTPPSGLKVSHALASPVKAAAATIVKSPLICILADDLEVTTKTFNYRLNVSLKKRVEPTLECVLSTRRRMMVLIWAQRWQVFADVRIC